jgi:hypothetical protein
MIKIIANKNLAYAYRYDEHVGGSYVCLYIDMKQKKEDDDY